MAKVKVTQIKSKNGATKRQIANLASLGLHKLHSSVEVELNPVSEGMMRKFSTLLKLKKSNRRTTDEIT